ncbi:MAG: VanZ family protein [Leptolyngbyaceae cyanobacterium bins.349]|nr:VanZ family protein [Leptolyngbyaceae cyanobacterium bins.349]
MTEQKKSLTRCRWLWIVLSVIYAGFFGVILLYAYQGKLPGILTQNDKPAHLILYAIATFVGHLACNRRKLRFANYALPLFPVLFTLFTTVEELLQTLSPNRTLDSWDLIASFVGIGLGYWLAELGRPR